MRKLMYLVLLTLVFVVNFEVSPSEKLEPLTPQELFSDDEISSFRLSPDGKYIAYVSP